jgi:DNA-binding MarR family transcriptional regulator
MTQSTSASKAEALRMLEQEVGKMLRRVRRSMRERAHLLHPELSAASYSLLVELVEGGPRRASELAEMFAIDKGAVSRHVQQLEDLGLLHRDPDPSDGRASLLYVTDEARRRLEEVSQVRRSKYVAMLGSWSSEELATFATALQRYNDSLD